MGQHTSFYGYTVCAANEMEVELIQGRNYYFLIMQCRFPPKPYRTVCIMRFVQYHGNVQYCIISPRCTFKNPIQYEIYVTVSALATVIARVASTMPCL
jgi:hypothetical protein